MKKFICFILIVTLFAFILTACGTPPWESADNPADYFFENSLSPILDHFEAYSGHGQFNDTISLATMDWASMEGIVHYSIAHPYLWVPHIEDGTLLDPSYICAVAVFDTEENATKAFSLREEYVGQHPETNHYIYRCGRIVFELPPCISASDAQNNYKRKLHAEINKEWDMVESIHNASVKSGVRPRTPVEMALEQIEAAKQNITNPEDLQAEFDRIHDSLYVIIRDMKDCAPQKIHTGFLDLDSSYNSVKEEVASLYSEAYKSMYHSLNELHQKYMSNEAPFNVSENAAPKK